MLDAHPIRNRKACLTADDNDISPSISLHAIHCICMPVLLRLGYRDKAGGHTDASARQWISPSSIFAILRKSGLFLPFVDETGIRDYRIGVIRRRRTWTKIDSCSVLESQRDEEYSSLRWHHDHPSCGRQDRQGDVARWRHSRHEQCSPNSSPMPFEVVCNY